MSTGLFDTNNIYTTSSTHSFLQEATPKVLSSFVASETRVEGFRTESCETVAKRLMDSIDKHPERYVPIFAEILKSKLISSASYQDLSIDMLVYEAFAEAFQETFEQAWYNGSNSKYIDKKNLFTLSRAQIKAKALALEVTDRLFKNKRTEIRNQIFDSLMQKLESSELNLTISASEKSHPLNSLRAELLTMRTNVIRAANTLFEKRIQEMRVLNFDAPENETSTRLEVDYDKWHARITSYTSLQVIFGDVLNLGTTEKRQLSTSSRKVYREIPHAWKDFKEKINASADPICMRNFTHKILNPIFKVIQETPPNIFDHLIAITTRYDLRGNCEDVREIYSSLSKEQKENIFLLLKNLENALESIPEIHIDANVLSKLQREYGEADSKENKAKAAIKLSPFLYEVSLSALVDKIKGSQRKMEKIRQTFDSSDFSKAPEKPPRVLKPRSVLPQLQAATIEENILEKNETHSNSNPLKSPKPSNPQPELPEPIANQEEDSLKENVSDNKEPLPNSKPPRPVKPSYIR